MHEFKDPDGTAWLVKVNVASVKRCRTMMDPGFDLLDVENAIQQIMCDPITLADVLFCCVHDQAVERGVSDEQFAALLAGDTIKHAKKALVEDLIDFFDDPADRRNLRTAVEKFGNMADQVRQLVGKKLTDGKVDREIEAALARIDLGIDEAISGEASGS